MSYSYPQHLLPDPHNTVPDSAYPPDYLYLMAVLEVARRLCLGEHAVPVERLSLPFVDPYNLSTITDEFIVVPLVSFKASQSKGWLEQGLQVPAKWWLRNHGGLPILQEVAHSPAEASNRRATPHAAKPQQPYDIKGSGQDPVVPE